MAKRRIRVRPGDVIEVPLGDGWLAYVRIYEDLGYRPYRIAVRDRPDLSTICASGFLDIVTVGEYQSETGAWPRIGKHPFVEGEDPWPPPVICGGRIIMRGEGRPATAEEMERYPEDRRYGESRFVDFLRKELLGLGPLDRPPPEVATVDPIDPEMSVDRNDVAEQVILQYEELIGDGVSPKKAIQKTIKFFEDSFDDSDEEPHIWLALAVVGLRDDCLTPTVREKALDVIESGRCWWVVENVEPESQRAAALEERKEAIAKLLKQLKPE